MYILYTNMYVYICISHIDTDATRECSVSTSAQSDPPLRNQ